MMPRKQMKTSNEYDSKYECEYKSKIDLLRKFTSHLLIKTKTVKILSVCVWLCIRVYYILTV